MTFPDQFSSRHGVMLNIGGNGVLVLGQPGIGKSSLALELLHQGHQLIADDVVDFSKQDNKIIAQCPKMLSALLHTRELGIIDVRTLFQRQAWQSRHQLDYVVRLQQHSHSEVSVNANEEPYLILGKTVPCLTLNIHNPASIAHRLLTWLALKTCQPSPETMMQQRQQGQMKSI